MVNPAWIAKGVGLMLLLALVCGYLTLCWLFYQGQWQLVLHPSKTITATPADIGLPFENVAFDVTETGQPRLTGWWVSAAPEGPFKDVTFLYLHNGWGSLSDTVAQVRQLHDAGGSVFVFDYRGFGKSEAVHPSEKKMNADADAAWAYLTGTRQIPAGQIVLYGDRLGAWLAASAALRHPAAAVVMVSPFPSMLPIVLHDPRGNGVPVRLLFHNAFDLEARMAQVKQPKLVIEKKSTPCGSGTLDKSPPCPAPAEVRALYERAAPPKVFFDGAGADTQFLQRFLRQYVSASTRPAK